MPTIRSDTAADYYNFELGANIKRLPLAPAMKCWAAAPIPARAVDGSASNPAGQPASLQRLGGGVYHPPEQRFCRTFMNARRLLCRSKSRFRFIYHKYYADYGSGDYGQEFDVMVSKKIRQVLERHGRIRRLSR